MAKYGGCDGCAGPEMEYATVTEMQSTAAMQSAGVEQAAASEKRSSRVVSHATPPVKRARVVDRRREFLFVVLREGGSYHRGVMEVQKVYYDAVKAEVWEWLVASKLNDCWEEGEPMQLCMPECVQQWYERVTSAEAGGGQMCFDTNCAVEVCLGIRYIDVKGDSQ